MPPRYYPVGETDGTPRQGSVISRTSEQPLLLQVNPFKLSAEGEEGEEWSTVLADGGGNPGMYNQAPLWSAWAILTNNMLGAGVLGIGHALAKTGTILGTCLLGTAVVLSAHGLYLLVQSAKTLKVKPSSFYSLCKASLPKWTSVVDAAIALKCFGVAISYLIVVGDLMPLAAQEWAGGGLPQGPWKLFEARSFWISVSFAVAAVLAVSKDLSALKYTSTVSVVLVLFVALCTVVFAVGGWDPCPADAAGLVEQCKGEMYTAEFSLDALKVLPIFIFAFTCQQNYVIMVNEMKRPTTRRVGAVILASTGTACGIYLLIAHMAYLTYGSAISNDILQTYPPSRAVTVLRVCMSVLVTFTYPLQAHPARNCALELWGALTRNPNKTKDGHMQVENCCRDDELDTEFAGSEGTQPDVEDDQRRGKPRQLTEPLLTAGQAQWRYWCATTAFLAGSYLIAMSVRDLSLVLEVVGATGSTTVVTLVPGAVYWKLHPKPHLQRYLAAAQFMVGLVIMPTCVGITLLKASESS